LTRIINYLKHLDMLSIFSLIYGDKQSIKKIFFPEIPSFFMNRRCMFFQMYAAKSKLSGEGEASARQHPRTRPIRCAHSAEWGERNR